MVMYEAETFLSERAKTKQVIWYGNKLSKDYVQSDNLKQIEKITN